MYTYIDAYIMKNKIKYKNKDPSIKTFIIVQIKDSKSENRHTDVPKPRQRKEKVVPPYSAGVNNPC